MYKRTLAPQFVKFSILILFEVIERHSFALRAKFAPALGVVLTGAIPLLFYGLSYQASTSGHYGPNHNFFFKK